MQLLGRLTPAQFMRRHWQKQPRLIRQAIPGFAGILSRRELFALAARDDVESRLVVRSSASRKSGWTLEHGPFRAADFRALPKDNWTLLVQGVDLHVEAAADLLQRFAFVSYARLDDLMISYATPGGGVGPHFDSYDVFLLQGSGRRRWRTSTQEDLALRPNLRLKILRRFTPADDAILDPGDMLYLPPAVAHDGIAVTECMTYSIGFRAPTGQELIESFLHFLPDALELRAARYSDPELRATATPARIEPRMQRKLAAMLKDLRWDPALATRFVGCLLSEPKPSVILERPGRPLGVPQFRRQIARPKTGGVRLDRRSRMLYDAAQVYLDGEVVATREGHPHLVQLADRRRLPADTDWNASELRIIYQAYLSGALHVGNTSQP